MMFPSAECMESSLTSWKAVWPVKSGYACVQVHTHQDRVQGFSVMAHGGEGDIFSDSPTQALLVGKKTQVHFFLFLTFS